MCQSLDIINHSFGHIGWLTPDRMTADGWRSCTLVNNEKESAIQMFEVRFNAA